MTHYETLLHQNIHLTFYHVTFLPQLPWQQCLTFPWYLSRFHFNSMFSYGVIAKKRFSFNQPMSARHQGLTLGHLSTMLKKLDIGRLGGDFYTKKGHTHTHVHPSPSRTHTPSHGHLLTLPRTHVNPPSDPGWPPDCRYSGTLTVTMATVAIATEISVNSPTGEGTTIFHPSYMGAMR